MIVGSLTRKGFLNLTWQSIYLYGWPRAYEVLAGYYDSLVYALGQLVKFFAPSFGVAGYQKRALTPFHVMGFFGG